MDRYQKVEKRKPESLVKENEIRITSQGVVRNYISYATTFLQERHVMIVLKAMGQAIHKTVAIAEIIKDTAISSTSITDIFEPIEEGLHTYQAPSNVDLTKLQYADTPQQQQPSRQAGVFPSPNRATYGRGRGHGRGRGRGWNRGGYANYQENANRDRYANCQENGNRGGYANYQGYSRGYSGDYPNWGRGGGRGGWGYRGTGYGRGRGGGGGGRGYGRGRGRTGPGTGGGNQE